MAGPYFHPTLTGVSELAYECNDTFSVDEGMSAVTKLKCRWDDRYTLVQYNLVNAIPYPRTSGFTDKLFPVWAGIVPMKGVFTNDVDLGIYDYAEVTIKYDNKLHGTSGADIASEEVTPSVEFVTLPKENFRWANAAGTAEEAAPNATLLDGEAPGKQQWGLNLKRTLYNRTAAPAAFLTEVGKANSASYVSPILGLTFGVETLLYAKGGANRVIRADGSFSMKIELEMQFKPQGWNTFWRARGTPGYYRLWDVAAGAAYVNYPLSAFTGLF